MGLIQITSNLTLDSERIISVHRVKEADNATDKLVIRIEVGNEYHEWKVVRTDVLPALFRHWNFP